MLLIMRRKNRILNHTAENTVIGETSTPTTDTSALPAEVTTSTTSTSKTTATATSISTATTLPVTSTPATSSSAAISTSSSATSTTTVSVFAIFRPESVRILIYYQGSRIIGMYAIQMHKRCKLLKVYLAPRIK